MLKEHLKKTEPAQDSLDYIAKYNFVIRRSVDCILWLELFTLSGPSFHEFLDALLQRMQGGRKNHIHY